MVSASNTGAMRRLLRGAFGLLTAAAIAAVPARAASDCPLPLASATRLLLVTTTGMNMVRARARLFERPSADAPWHEMGTAKRAVVGRAGMSWGFPFRAAAASGEPVKIEGDGRSPAGFFLLGRPFGFAPGGDSNYLQLIPGETFCVDDVASTHYNTVVPQATAGDGVSGERMWTIDQYRRGLLVDYPSNREASAGSCIFVHIWRSSRTGTAGCVAFAEADVAELQAWSRLANTVIGILPEAGLERFRDCLPGIP